MSKIHNYNKVSTRSLLKIFGKRIEKILQPSFRTKRPSSGLKTNKFNKSGRNAYANTKELTKRILMGSVTN